MNDQRTPTYLILLSLAVCLYLAMLSTWRLTELSAQPLRSKGCCASDNALEPCECRSLISWASINRELTKGSSAFLPESTSTLAPAPAAPHILPPLKTLRSFSASDAQQVIVSAQNQQYLILTVEEYAVVSDEVNAAAQLQIDVGVLQGQLRAAQDALAACKAAAPACPVCPTCPVAPVTPVTPPTCNAVYEENHAQLGTLPSDAELRARCYKAGDFKFMQPGVWMISIHKDPPPFSAWVGAGAIAP